MEIRRGRLDGKKVLKTRVKACIFMVSKFFVVSKTRFERNGVLFHHYYSKFYFTHMTDNISVSHGQTL